MSASDYVNIDETLETGDVFTEDEIVALVTGIEDTEEDSDTDNSSSDPPLLSQPLRKPLKLQGYCTATLIAKEMKTASGK